MSGFAGLSELISNGIHDDHSGDIVAALGGIDKILTEYIRISEQYEHEELLNTSQIKQITDILNQEHIQTIWDKIYAMANLRDDVFHLSRSDTLLHRICFYKETVDQLIGFLFSKMTMVTWAIFAMVIIILHGLSNNGILTQDVRGNTLWFISETSLVVITIIYCTLITLSCNISAFLLVISGFDFWVKLYYALLFAVTNALYVRRTEHTVQEEIIEDLIGIMLVFVIVCVSLVEGYHASWKASFAFGLLLSVIFTWRSLNLSWLAGDRWPEREWELWSGMSIGLVSYMSGSLRVISLFFWKQTLMAAYTKGEWCICIFLSPQIKWYDDDEKTLREGLECTIAPTTSQ